MGRIYMASIVCAAHAAQIDYFELLAPTGSPVLVHGFGFGQTSDYGDAQAEGLELRLKRVTVSPTSGSGGTTVTPQPTEPGMPAFGAGGVLETGNTTKLTGGTSVELGRFGWPIAGDFLWLPPPEGRIVVQAATRLVLEEATTPTDSITGPMGWILFEELV